MPVSYHGDWTRVLNLYKYLVEAPEFAENETKEPKIQNTINKPDDKKEKKELLDADYPGRL